MVSADIQALQQRIRERAATAPKHIDPPKPEKAGYEDLTLPELQAKYTALEAWMLAHKADPRFFVAKVKLQQLNKLIMSQTK